MPSLVTNFVMGHVRSLAKEYMFNSTLDVFRAALAADTVSEGVELILARAQRDNEEFWMDILILAVAVLLIAMFTTCGVRVFCWVCIGIPKEAYDMEQMRKGKKAYQIKARQEREERRRRQEAGLEEKPVPLTEDMHALMTAVSEVRGRLSAKGVNVSEVAVPGQERASAEEAVSAKYEHKATAHRQGFRTPPASVLRGFPEVDLLIASPSQRYLLVSCRCKRKTYLFPQANNVDFPRQGKELATAAQAGTVTLVEKALVQAMNTERQPEVFSAAFTIDDARLLVGERDTDTIFAFSLSAPAGSLSLLWSFKMPDRRLVSSLPLWTMLNPESLVTLTDQDCEVEVITHAAGATACSTKSRFKIGTATAWAQSGEEIGVAGSFLREPRLARVATRANGAMTLETISLFPNPLKVRVTALALVAKDVPAFNTRNYFIVYLESGLCTIYDVDSLSKSNTPVVCASFTDTEFAGFEEKTPMRLRTCVTGKSYQERLLLALYRGGEKVAVYAQVGHGATFEMKLLTDIFQPQEGGKITNGVFLQNGKGFATSGTADNRHVRMFILPE